MYMPVCICLYRHMSVCTYGTHNQTSTRQERTAHAKTLTAWRIVGSELPCDLNRQFQIPPEKRALGLE